MKLNSMQAPCPICGKGRSSKTDHTTCAKKIQALRAAENKPKAIDGKSKKFAHYSEHIAQIAEH